MDYFFAKGERRRWKPKGRSFSIGKQYFDCFEFKTIVQENFLSYMPFYFRGMELLISPVAKKNMTLDGLRLKGNGVTGTPVIYINDMYALYEENGDLEETIKIFANVLANAFKDIPNINVDSLFQNASKKIVFQLVNTELNKSLFQVPLLSYSCRMYWLHHY